MKVLFAIPLLAFTVFSHSSVASAETWVSLREDGYRSDNQTVSVAEGSGQPQDTVRLAVSFLGTPYTWSGSTPVEGFDSSGFIHEVLRLNRLSVPRYLDGQYSATSLVDSRKLQAGDLIFFGSDDQPDQVGIYIGDDKFVHASHEAKAVVLSKLSSPYFRARLLSVRRVPGSQSSDVLPNLIHVLRDFVPSTYMKTYTTTVRSFSEKKPLQTGRPVVRASSRYSTSRYYADYEQAVALFEPKLEALESLPHPLTLRLGEMTDIVVSVLPSWN